MLTVAAALTAGGVFTGQGPIRDATSSDRSTRMDTIAVVPPRGQTSRSQVDGRLVISQRVMPFVAQDEWGVGADGVVAIARVADFRVEWYADDQRMPNGPRLAFSSLPVAHLQRRLPSPTCTPTHARAFPTYYA